MAKSTKSNRTDKPAKPKFPLTPHPTGRWCKKIRGRLHYFGRIADDPQGEDAIERLNRELPYLQEGRTPPPPEAQGGCTMRILANEFLNAKRDKLEAGELSERSFGDYYGTCKLLVDHFGAFRRVDDLRPIDFGGLRSKLSAKCGVVTLKNTINRIRVVLKFAFDQNLIDRPVKFGQSFDRPSMKTLRQSRYEAGPNLLTADEIRRILDAADPFTKALTLLAINCGFGQSDCAALPKSALDLDGGWLDFPRPKTAIMRRCPLWPETVEALKVAITNRPAPKDPADDRLVFITVQGNPWVRVRPKQTGEEDQYVKVDTVGARFGALLRKLKINGRKRLGFYTMRHTFETVAGESKDQVAVDSIMGHADPSMAAVYRERISDERLRAVVDVVRSWLWPADQKH